MLRINHAFYTLSDLASELSVGWDEAFCRLINSNHSDRFFLSAFGKGSISRKGPCDFLSKRERPLVGKPSITDSSLSILLIDRCSVYSNRRRIQQQFAGVHPIYINNVGYMAH